MAQEYNAEIGRGLGWDLAYYGWDPREDAPVDVIEGHTAGKAHFGSRRKTPDRFERKWLQLRQSAIRRGRVVDESVTPEFIASIDHPICPVTLVEMTHSARQDTDCSVDRVNNEGAYSDGNLVVMSVRANRAKGSKTYQALESILSGQSEDPGLSKEEWARLRCIMHGCTQCKKRGGIHSPIADTHSEPLHTTVLFSVAAHCAVDGSKRRRHWLPSGSLPVLRKSRHRQNFQRR